uniref:Cyclin N-terminal domain containing 2 n=1 Tax=Neogobius melanostomus TaxID=47308 RepID=A0A8C6T394_9GOBI
MAGAGFCDLRPLLDLYQKVCSLCLQCVQKRHTTNPSNQMIVMSHLTPAKKHFYIGFPATDTLHALVPSLLRCEVAIALEKLNFIWDQTYAWEMFMDMMKCQVSYTFSNTDLPSHFTDAKRAILVDWLVKIHEMMHFQDETLYLAIYLLNRSLRLMKVTTANLQLLGIICLFVAAKKEESLLPEVSDLCYVMDYTYTKQQVLRMERKVLNRLKFDLSYFPPLHFLLLFATVARCSAKMTWMRCVVFTPVQLAEAALRLARLVLKEPPTAEGEAAWCLVSSLHICKWEVNGLNLCFTIFSQNKFVCIWTLHQTRKF